MTNAQINQNSASFRLTRRPQPLPCDGLGYPCENAATRHLVLDGPDPDRTPVYISMNLCAACYATWMSWAPSDDEVK